jgi:hypothetical protein
MDRKPPMAKSRMMASVPPEMTTSAAPRRMNSAPSPMDWVPVAQAVLMVILGPRQRNSLAIRKADRLGMPPGRTKGLTRV